MKLYLFTITNENDPKLIMRELEALEDGDTYLCCKEHLLFRKNKVGIASGFDKNECLLLENNPSEAAYVLLKEKKEELEKMQEELNKKQTIVEVLKNEMLKNFKPNN